MLSEARLPRRWLLGLCICSWISAVLPINLQYFQHARKSPHRKILRTHGAKFTLDEENKCFSPASPAEQLRTIRPKLVKVGAGTMLARRRLSHYAPRTNGVPASLSPPAMSNAPGVAGRAIERESAHQSVQALHRVCIGVSEIVISFAASLPPPPFGPFPPFRLTSDQAGPHRNVD